MIALPAAFLCVLYLLPIKRVKALLYGSKGSDRGENVSPHAAKWKIAVLVLAVTVVMIVLALMAPTDAAWGPFDPFHEGESLAPAIGCLHGQVVYKDFLVWHGYFQDPGRALLAFKLFGKSIASVRIVASLAKVFAFVLFGILILYVCRWDFLCSLPVVAAWFVLCSTTAVADPNSSALSWAVLIGRDLTGALFLLAVGPLQRALSRPAAKPISIAVTSFCSAFIAAGAFSYSIDRGVFLTSAYFVIALALYLAYVRGRKTVEQLHFLAPGILGIAAGMCILGVLTHWRLVETLTFALRTLPAYFPLSDTIPFPIERTQWFVVVTLIGANAFWVLVKWLEVHYRRVSDERSVRRFLDLYFIEFALLMVSIVSFLGALGISDWVHVSTYAATTYVLSLVILFRHGLAGVLGSSWWRKPVVCVCAVVLIGLVSNGSDQIAEGNLIGEGFPFGKTDSEYMPPNYVATLDFLKKHLRSNESFLTLTSEGAWYYFLDRPLPIRFADTYAASTDFYQDEVVRDMKRNNVKFVLVGNHHWSNYWPARLPVTVRQPIIVKYILADYEPCTTIDDNELWIKRSDAAESL